MKQFIGQLDSTLLAQTRELDRLNMLLRSSLPPECDGHYQVAGIRDKTVIIVTDSPVWTTRLRQLGPQILQNLPDNITAGIQHVRISTRMGPTVSDYKTPLVKHDLSSKSASHITQCASYINDEKLKGALLHIARHADKDKD